LQSSSSHTPGLAGASQRKNPSIAPENSSTLRNSGMETKERHAMGEYLLDVSARSGDIIQMENP
jgi:hypothetical protein